ncbi:MAG TPA: hypothetical protein VFY89_08695 [Ktedonobacterales bacterium]
MRHPLTSPCAAWAEPLAKGHPNDLTPAARAALDAHVATCAACAAARAAYAAMDARLRALPAVPPLVALPAGLRPLEGEKAAPPMRQPAGQVIAFPGRTAPSARPRPVARLGGLGRAVALVAVLAIVLGGYALLLHRQGAGLANLPAYSAARIGAFHLVQPPAPGAQITVQGSVPGLLYACTHAPGGVVSSMKPPRFWRSEDGGATWRSLPTPAELAQAATSFCFVGTSPADPNTIFSVTNSGVIYSADRGEHWAEVHGPPHGSRSVQGAEPWAVAGGLWVIQYGSFEKPVIWVSRDHGAHWSRYDYPVPLSSSKPCCADRTALLSVGQSEMDGYSRGGLIWPHAHTLWWTPDYGAHWQQLDTWNPPGGDSTYFMGTADLSVLYAVSDGPKNTKLLWRSTDIGKSWQHVAVGPAIVSPGHPSPDVSHQPPQSYRVLHDGTLLVLAPISAKSSQVAFYTLAPGGTAWRQASGPLPDGLCQITSVKPSQGLSPCAKDLSMRVIDSGKGAAQIYLGGGSLPDDPISSWVAPITWG